MNPTPESKTLYRVAYRIADGRLETSGETPEFGSEAEADAAVTVLRTLNETTLDLRVWDIRIDVGTMKPCRVWEPTFVEAVAP